MYCLPLDGTRSLHTHSLSTQRIQTNIRKPLFISGIGSGISYMFNNQHKFNILTLYSTNRWALCLLLNEWQLFLILFAVINLYVFVSVGQSEKEPECNRRASAINSLPLKEMTTQGTQCAFLLLRFSRCAKWWMGSSMLPMQSLREVK